MPTLTIAVLSPCGGSEIVRDVPVPYRYDCVEIRRVYGRVDHARRRAHGNRSRGPRPGRVRVEVRWGGGRGDDRRTAAAAVRVAESTGVQRAGGPAGRGGV